MKQRCLSCTGHPGWATADESRRSEPRDLCPKCLGSGFAVAPDNVSAITSTTGVRFNVVILREGDRYGLDDCLTVGEGTSARIEGSGPFVEFYDTRYAHTPLGQFVSRYGVDTILESTSGLDLMTSEPSWKIDAAAMDIVRAWLRHETKGHDAP